MKRSFNYQLASFFALLSILFIPFPFNISKAQLSVTEFIFGDLIGFFSKNIFRQPLTDTHVHSDTAAMYILVLLLFIFSLLIGLVLGRLNAWAKYRDKVLRFIYLLACYYLALQLLKYGLDKIFKNQFYLPEPNTLYTPMGRIPKDLLYWSSIGTSHFYNIFLGSLESLAAIFILINRTRLIGLLLSLFIMNNIVAVNFGFDISVKLYSLFLVFLVLFLLVPYLKSLFQFFFTNRAVTGRTADVTALFIRNRFWSICLKWFVTALIFLEAFYPFIRSGNFDGDRAARPYMHGAYEVTRYIAGSDTLAPVNFPVKRFFIHKDGYMIFQNREDEMTDYKLSYGMNKYEYVLTDYRMNKTVLHINYDRADSVLTLQYSNGDRSFQLTGKFLDWRNLPAVRHGFHWTIVGDE